MSTQAVSSASIYKELQSFYQNRQSDLQTLGNALQSGNLNAAQQSYQQLAALGKSGPFSSSEPFSQSNRASDFEAIGQALSSGDLAGAQNAFAKLQQTFGQANGSSATSSSASGSSATSSPAYAVSLSNQSNVAVASSGSSSPQSIYEQLQDFRSERKSDLQQLGTALSSGDVKTAEQDYQNLVQLGEQGPSASGQAFERSDRSGDFQAIGQALQSGNLASAQQAFTTLENTFSSNGSSNSGSAGILSVPLTKSGPAPAIQLQNAIQPQNRRVSLNVLG